MFPLFTADMYTNLGPQWAGTLVAFLALAFAPAPILLYMYGRKLRRMTKIGREADDLGVMIVKMMQAQQAADQHAAHPEVHRSPDEDEEEAIARSIADMDEETALDTMVELVRTETRKTQASQRSGYGEGEKQS